MKPWHQLSPVEKQEAVISLIITGMTYSQVAEKFNIPRNAVAGVVNRYKTRTGLIPKSDPRLPKPPKLPIPPKPIEAKPPRGGLTIVYFEKKHRPERIVPEEMWAPLKGTTPVKLTEARASQCRWPVGMHTYCGASSVDNGFGRITYCASHNAVAYRTPDVRHGPRSSR